MLSSQTKSIAIYNSESTYVLFTLYHNNCAEKRVVLTYVIRAESINFLPHVDS